MYEFIHAYGWYLLTVWQLISFLILSSMARNNYDPMDNWDLTQWVIMIVAALVPPVVIIALLINFFAFVAERWEDIHESLTKERQIRLLTGNSTKLLDLYGVKEVEKPD